MGKEVDMKEELISAIKSIIDTDVSLDEDLLASDLLDSFALVEAINAIEEIGRKHSLTVNIDSLVTEETLCINDILLHFEQLTGRS